MGLPAPIPPASRSRVSGAGVWAGSRRAVGVLSPVRWPPAARSGPAAGMPASSHSGTLGEGNPPSHPVTFRSPSSPTWAVPAGERPNGFGPHHPTVRLTLSVLRTPIRAKAHRSAAPASLSHWHCYRHARFEDVASRSWRMACQHSVHVSRTISASGRLTSPAPSARDALTRHTPSNVRQSGISDH